MNTCRDFSYLALSDRSCFSNLCGRVCFCFLKTALADDMKACGVADWLHRQPAVHSGTVVQSIEAEQFCFNWVSDRAWCLRVKVLWDTRNRGAKWKMQFLNPMKPYSRSLVHSLGVCCSLEHTIMYLHVYIYTYSMFANRAGLKCLTFSVVLLLRIPQRLRDAESISLLLAQVFPRQASARCIEHSV